MYEINITIQIYGQVFSIIISIYFVIFPICLFFKSLSKGPFDEYFQRNSTIIYSVYKMDRFASSFHSSQWRSIFLIWFNYKYKFPLDARSLRVRRRRAKQSPPGKQWFNLIRFACVGLLRRKLLAMTMELCGDSSNKKSPGLLQGFWLKSATTYSPTIAVPSALSGLTSLFGMGRGGTPTL